MAGIESGNVQIPGNRVEKNSVSQNKDKNKNVAPPIMAQYEQQFYEQVVRFPILVITCCF